MTIESINIIIALKHTHLYSARPENKEADSSGVGCVLGTTDHTR